jgi:hypothetical protein
LVQKEFRSSGLFIRKATHLARNLQTTAKTRHFVLGVLTFLMFVWAFRDFFGTGMLAYGDQSPFPQSTQQAFDVFFSSWHPISLGSTAQYPLNYFLVGVTIFLTGGNAILVQKIWLFVPMALSFASMYIFSRRFSSSTPVRWVSSFVYSVNPLTLGPPYIGGATGLLFTFSLLPLLFELLIQLFASSRNSARNSLLFTLLFVVSGGLITAFYLFPLFISLLAYVLARGKVRFALSRLALLAGSIFLFFGLTLPSTYSNPPVFARYLPSYLSSAQPPIRLSELVGGIAYTYSGETARNLLNFGAMALPFPGYSSDFAWWSALGVVYPIIAFSSLLFVRRNKAAKFIAWFSTYSLAVLTFIGVTKLGPGLEIFRAFPFLFTFSNPSGLLLMVMLGYAPLVAITLDRILTVCRGRFIAIGRGRNYRKIVGTGFLVIAICLLLTGTYIWPFFTGNMGFSSMGVQLSGRAIPSVYYDASGWINQRKSSNETFRTLWIPLDYQAQLDVRWLDTSALTFPLGIGQYVTYPITRYVGFVFNALANNGSIRIGSLLGPLNVKYVVVNLESPQGGPPTASGFLNYGEPFLSGSPRAYASILNSQRDLRLIENSTAFMVYLNLAFQPRVKTFDKAQYIASVGARDEYASNLETLDFLSHFPGYDLSREMLILDGSLPVTQRPWFMNRSDAIVTNIEDTGGTPSLNASASQGIFQVIRIETALGIWTPVSGKWEVQGGELIGTSSDMPNTWSSADIFYEHYNLSDLEVKTQFYIHSPIPDSAYEEPGVVLRQSSDGFYLVKVEPGYNRIVVYRSGLPGPLASAPIVVQSNTWYNLTSTISGPAGSVHLSVSLDNTKLIDAYDTNSPNRFLRGYVGLHSEGYHSSVISFKDVEISTLDGTVIYHPAAPSPYTIAGAEIEPSRVDDYSLFAYAPGNGSVTFYLGNRTVNSTRIADGWFSSPPIHLEQRAYNLTVGYGRRSLSLSSTLQSHVALVSSNFANATAISTRPSSISSFQQVSSTEYELTLTAQGPTFVQLSDMYAPEWNAVTNGVELVHYVASAYLNGYYVENKGVYHILIEYQGQNTKNLVTIVWIAAWLFVLFGLGYVFRRQMRLRLRMAHTTIRERT